MSREAEIKRIEEEILRLMKQLEEVREVTEEEVSDMYGFCSYRLHCMDSAIDDYCYIDGSYVAETLKERFTEKERYILFTHFPNNIILRKITEQVRLKYTEDVDFIEETIRERFSNILDNGK